VPRALALDLIEAVLAKKRPLDETFEAHSRLQTLEARDRAFARLIAAETLRRLGQIDAVLAAFLEKPLTGKARPVQDLLRAGICQLLFLKTPPHAAVSSMVDLAEERGLGPYKKLVNAVLRRSAREGTALIETQDAARLVTPDWLWNSWTGAYGEATTRKLAEAHLHEAPLDFSVKSDAADWAERLGAEMLPTGTLRLREPRGPVPQLAGYDEGTWWVQDAAAVLPVKLLGDVAGKRVIDLCAAPGGKTSALAAAGATVTAVDRSKRRLDRLNQNLTRLNLTAEVVVADAERWRPSEPADAVLLDAPCSATGTIRRHPDIPRLKGPEDVTKMADLQSRLLGAAVEMVRPGGTLVYCVCSLQPEEGPEQAARVLRAGFPLELLPLGEGDVAGQPEFLDGSGALRTLPCHWAERGGMDGFYAARFRRR
jgi:16S rRNA (cytosine967-C5)-methyltransferase